MNNENNFNTSEWKNLKCPKCGKTNIGWQTHCLLCGADLSTSGVQEEPVYKCPYCDAKVMKGQKFCTECGHKLPEKLEEVNAVPSEKRCPKCGALLEPGTKFCTQCGAKV